MKTVYKVVNAKLQSAMISDCGKIQYELKEWVKKKNIFCFLSLEDARNFVALNDLWVYLRIYKANATGLRSIKYISPWHDNNTIQRFWRNKNRKVFSLNTLAPRGTYICNAIRLEEGPLRK